MKIKGGSVENTLDLAVFGDILVWVATFLGLVPWDRWFGRMKDFQEQLAELDDGFHVDVSPFMGDRIDSLGGGHEVHEHDERLATDIGPIVQVPGGVIYRFPDEPDEPYDPYVATVQALAGYQCRVGRRF